LGHRTGSGAKHRSSYRGGSDNRFSIVIRRVTRITGALLIVGAAGLLAWVAVVWMWEDPFTSVLNAIEQRKLASRYEERLRAFRVELGGQPASLAASRGGLPEEARRYRLRSARGEPIARIRIPHIGVDAIVVDGVDRESLKKGPGRDRRTSMPGESKLAYIAGHRTSYGAPFSRIDDLRPGDGVTLELPYATFEYEVVGHRIVAGTYVQALRSRGREELALQACWPRFSAAKRYIVYARPTRIRLPGGDSVVPVARRGTEVTSPA
jgi:sortase A